MPSVAPLSVAASASAGGLMVEDGKEYIFTTSASMVAGTMDIAGHVAGNSAKMKTRLQTSNNAKTLTLKMENIEFAEYVGPFDSKSWPFDGLTVSYDQVNLMTAASSPGKV